MDFKLILDELYFGVMAIDQEDKIIYYNKAEAGLRGVESNTLLGKSIYACHREEARREIGDIISSFKSKGQAGSTRLRHRGGKYIEQWIAPIFAETSDYLGMVMTSLDVTHRENTQRHYANLATKDELTGLYNQNHFGTVLPEMIETLGRGHEGLALMVIDCNWLKEVNDYLGHAAGDQVLAKTAEVIRASVRDSDLVFRIGGDEFAVIMPEGSEEAAEAARNRIKSAARHWSRANPGLPVSLAIGWSVATNQLQAASLFQTADAAMYDDKQREKRAIGSLDLAAAAASEPQ